MHDETNYCWCTTDEGEPQQRLVKEATSCLNSHLILAIRYICEPRRVEAEQFTQVPILYTNECTVAWGAGVTSR